MQTLVFVCVYIFLTICTQKQKILLKVQIPVKNLAEKLDISKTLSLYANKQVCVIKESSTGGIAIHILPKKAMEYRNKSLNLR